MAKFNADAEVEVFEVRIDGVDYVVPPISAGVLRKLNAFQDSANETDPDGPAKLLGILLGVDWQRFAETDLRKIKAVIEYISPATQADQKKTSTSQ
jgi:hypothetical protein